MVHFRPEKAFQLAVYASIIMGLARDTRKPHMWIRYDRLFRQSMAVNPALEWHQREPNLWLMATSDFAFSSASGYSPQVRQSQPSAASTSVHFSYEPCRHFNRGVCPFTEAHCRYRHGMFRYMYRICMYICVYVSMSEIAVWLSRTAFPIHSMFNPPCLQVRDLCVYPGFIHLLCCFRHLYIATRPLAHGNFSDHDSNLCPEVCQTSGPSTPPPCFRGNSTSPEHPSSHHPSQGRCMGPGFAVSS